MAEPAESADTNVIIGVFDDRKDAEQAMDELLQKGFEEHELGFACPGKKGDTEIASKPGQTPKPGMHAEAGILGGGAAGGALGAVASGLIPGIGPIVAVGALTGVLGGAAVGGAAGTFAAVMKDMGVEEQVAQTCEEELRSGSSILTVETGNDTKEIREFLQDRGARDVKGARG